MLLSFPEPGWLGGNRLLAASQALATTTRPPVRASLQPRGRALRFPRGAGPGTAPSRAGLTCPGPAPSRAPGGSGRGGAAPRPARPQPTPAPGGRAGSRYREPGEGAERPGGRGGRGERGQRSRRGRWWVLDGSPRAGASAGPRLRREMRCAPAGRARAVRSSRGRGTVAASGSRRCLGASSCQHLDGAGAGGRSKAGAVWVCNRPEPCGVRDFGRAERRGETGGQTAGESAELGLGFKADRGAKSGRASSSVFLCALHAGPARVPPLPLPRLFTFVVE